MAGFRSRDDYEKWKAQKALKRYGQSELERSDQEWAKKEPPVEKEGGGNWVWVALLAICVGFALYFVLERT